MNEIEKCSICEEVSTMGIETPPGEMGIYFCPKHAKQFKKSNRLDKGQMIRRALTPKPTSSKSA